MKEEKSKKDRTIKLMQLRVPMEIYRKIKELSYLQETPMQTIVLELFEKEFGK